MMMATLLLLLLLLLVVLVVVKGGLRVTERLASLAAHPLLLAFLVLGQHQHRL